MHRLAFRGIVLVFVLSNVAYASQKVEVIPLRDGVLTTAVTVGVAATPLPATALVGRKNLTITNNSDNTIFIGDSSVTINNGEPIYKKQTLSEDVAEGVIYYGIAAGAGNNVRVKELR